MSVPQPEQSPLTKPTLDELLALGMKKQCAQSDFKHEIYVTATHNDVLPAHEVGNGDCEFEDSSENEWRERRQERDVPAEKFPICHEITTEWETQNEADGDKRV